MDWTNIEQISAEILAKLPQKEPFRFLDRIIEVDSEHIVGQYTFRPEADFYRGHFPGNPVTPGVILLETIAQTAVVSFGIYLGMKDHPNDPEFAADRNLFLFVDCQADFMKSVLPGETVTIKAEKLFWRRKKLRAKAEMFLSSGETAVVATVSGLGVSR